MEKFEVATTSSRYLIIRFPVLRWNIDIEIDLSVWSKK